MSVKIIDTLKPKNNGSFPIVEAVDVEVSEGVRLPEALEAKADVSALAETDAAVALKADASAVETATANLQGQINQIEISATAEAVVAPEVAGARVGADSTSYTTLKERLDAEKSQSDSDFAAVKTDLTDTQKVLGGTFRLYYVEVSTMIGSDGTQKSETSAIKFYKVNDLKGSKKIKVTVSASGSSIITHWFNQLDSNGNVISYTPITIAADETEADVTLLNNTASIVISMNVANGDFALLSVVEGQITGAIEENTSDIENLKTDNAKINSDLEKTFSAIGGDILCESEEVSTMIGSDGTTKQETQAIKFYKVNDLKGAHKLNVIVASYGDRTIGAHWFNQLDNNGTVISYAPFNMGQTGTEITVDLLNDTKAIVVSMNVANGDFSIFARFDGEINASIDENTQSIEQLAGEISGAETVVVPSETNQMYNGNGESKTPTSATKFYEVSNVSGASKIKITYSASGLYNTHWWNEFDENGNLIYYATLNSSSKTLEVELHAQTKSVKFLMWNDMGEFTCKKIVAREVLRFSDVSGWYSKLSALGDSITAGMWYDDGAWKTVQNTYHKLIADKIGISFQNLGISSTPICPNSNYTDGQNDNAFVYRYSDIAEDADLIIVAGGTNDFRHLVPLGNASDGADKYELTFYGAVDYLINNIMDDHPESRLVFVTPFHQTGDTSAKTTLADETVYLSDYIVAIKEKCKQYGVLCIDAFAESGVSLRSDFVERFMPDSLHPNQGGHEIIFRNLMHYFATL